MKILSLSIVYITIIVALSLGLLYVLLRRRRKTKKSVIEIHQILHRYIYETYVYLIFQMNPEKKKIDRDQVKPTFEEIFNASTLSEALSHFVRCDEVVSRLKIDSEQKVKNPFLLPDVFVRRTGNNFYQHLLAAASKIVYQKNVFDHMTNEQAKNHLRYYF
jgi:hypothetical protein|tara:strand:+ start:160 stop:642 length:483 start_codon:yes stop_codon:yes gene_type:complete